MEDWQKLLLTDSGIIKELIENKKLSQLHGLYDRNTYEVFDYPLKGIFQNECVVEILSENYALIKLSFHKYWNQEKNGTYGNSNDFRYFDYCESVKHFCKQIGISPLLLKPINRECGVNMKLTDVSASLILKNIIAHKNQPRGKIFDDVRGCYIQFEKDDGFLKYYDKGRQSFRDWNIDVGEVCRVEFKATNSGYNFDCSPNLFTLADYLKPENYWGIVNKFIDLQKGLAFDDPSIDSKKLTAIDKKVYDLMRNPNQWDTKGIRTGSHRAREKRYREIIKANGSYGFHEIFQNQLEAKCADLMGMTDEEEKRVNEYDPLKYQEFCWFSSLVYSKNNDKINIDKEEIVGIDRDCISCNRNISLQRKGSKYCSEKYVGKEKAQRCRNRGKRLKSKTETNFETVPPEYVVENSHNKTIYTHSGLLRTNKPSPLNEIYEIHAAGELDCIELVGGMLYESELKGHPP